MQVNYKHMFKTNELILICVLCIYAVVQIILSDEYSKLQTELEILNKRINNGFDKLNIKPGTQDILSNIPSVFRRKLAAYLMRKSEEHQQGSIENTDITSKPTQGEHETNNTNANGIPNPRKDNKDDPRLVSIPHRFRENEAVPKLPPNNIRRQPIQTNDDLDNSQADISNSRSLTSAKYTSKGNEFIYSYSEINDTDRSIDILDLLRESAGAISQKRFLTRLKRDDGRRHDSFRREQQDEEHNVDTEDSEGAKYMTLELSVYERSLEIEEVSSINDWGPMRGFNIPGKYVLKYEDHLNSVNHNKYIKIQETGYYLVYAQLSFGAANLDEEIGFKVVRTRQGTDVSLAACVNHERWSDSSGTPAHVARSCFVQTTAELEEADKLSIEVVYSGQSIYPYREMTYFGIMLFG